MIEIAGTPHGRLVFGNNEDAVEGFGNDAVKRRVAAQPGSAACVSFNAMRPDGVEDENALVRTVANPNLSLMEFAELVKVDDSEQGMVYARRIAPDPENGNRLTMFFYLPVKFMAGQPVTLPAPPAPAPPPPTDPTPSVDYPHAILYRLNCTGDVGVLRTIGDNVMIRAVAPSLDVRLEVEIAVTAPGTLQVEFIRNDGGDPAPYCYVYVNDNGVWQQQLTADRVVARVNIWQGVVRVKALVSAQNGGSCHIGGILVSR